MKQYSYLFAFILLAFGCKKKEGKPEPQEQQEVISHSAVVEPAWNAAANQSPRCFLDVNSGKVYDPETAMANGGDIDFWWIARPFYNDATFASPDATANMSYTDYEKADLGMLSWERLNHSLIEASDQISHAEFEAIKTVPELIEAWKRDEPVVGYVPMEATSTQMGFIYTFETAQQKRGLLRFKNGSFGPTGSVTVEIKVES